MTTATTALIVSITSACITLGGLVWQFTLYRLSGARLRVDLLFHYRGESRAIVQTAGGKRKAFSDPQFEDHSLDDLGIEAVRVRVTNVGRTPVSVDDIALDVGRTRTGKVWRRGVGGSHRLRSATRTPRTGSFGSRRAMVPFASKPGP